ncbi:MAG: hypothetical protein H7323_02970 [Frankiales bacterium]|nr:hypothetical protein [Frankiales bacterium]
MTAPEQHHPPVYAVAAGAVVHAHAGDTLEPAVLLHTFLPAGVDLRDAPARVDVHGDGPGSETLTLRVLTDGVSLSWQLPIAPFVAALPGQPGDDGRMVLLAVVDTEPEGAFWAQAADCERLAAELQIPVTDLTEALRGRLTPWLAEDLDLLLHDDAHDRAVDRSPAQTLASAVLFSYRGTLEAETATTAVVRALELAPEDFTVELGARLCASLVTAFDLASSDALDAVTAQTGPFETEALRLLSTLPPALAATGQGQIEAAMTVLLESADRDETVRAAVSLVARLARAQLGAELEDDDLLRRLGMVDDAALLRLAGLWVDLAAADGDVGALARRVRAEGSPGLSWLRATAAALATAARHLAGRSAERIAAPLDAIEALLRDSDPNLVAAVGACRELAPYARSRGQVGPGSWLAVPAPVAAEATMRAYLDGRDRELAVDLLTELLADDVEGADLLDGLVCATSQLLAHVEHTADADVRRAQVGELLAGVPGGPRGARWLMAALLREAPGHDAAAADLSLWLTAESSPDPDKTAQKLGRQGTLTAGLSCLESLAAVLGDTAQMDREELLGQVLPSALDEHDLLRRTP